MLYYAIAKLLRDAVGSTVPNIDPGQVRKLAGWGLTQNDKALRRLVSPAFGCGPSPSSALSKRAHNPLMKSNEPTKS